MTQSPAKAALPVYIYYTHTDYYSARSSLLPLVGRVGAVQMAPKCQWARLQKRSWTLGEMVKRWGQWYYGSTWNTSFPVVDELRYAFAMPNGQRSIAHFLFAEFNGLRWGWPLRQKGAIVVGTFHASKVRQPKVLGGVRDFGCYDWITVVSEVQKPFFQDKGVLSERLRVIPLGVDTTFFCPDQRPRAEGGALQGLLMGNTERDHAFMAELMRKLPPGILHLRVRTAGVNQHHYRDVPGIEILPSLNDDALLDAYRAAELLVMPMDDCTANNAVLESMACGTPVMANRVGGIPEYVSEVGNVLMDGKKIDDWVDRLVDLKNRRDALRDNRLAVRACAERFEWDLIAQQYLRLYREMLG